MTSGPTGDTPAPCIGCSRGVDRRTFLSAATLAAVAAALDGCSGLTAPGATFSGSYGGPFTVTLANYGALSGVGGVARDGGGQWVAHSGAFYRTARRLFDGRGYVPR